MKKTVLLLSLLAIFAVSYYNVPVFRKLLSYSPCSTPLTYKIGSIDSRFNLSTETVKEYSANAAGVWNETVEKPLFAYDPEGKITINLIYDQRQKLSSKLDSLQKQLDSNKNNLDPQIADYNTRALSFDQKTSELNKEIEYWNSQGGAPQDEYKKLLAKQQELQQEAAELNLVARSLNQSTREYNTQVDQLKQTENQFNETLTYRPEEGIWNGNDNTISIFFNNSQAELIHTLAHEFGHARGLDHNINPDSIMYKSSSEIINPSSDDIVAVRDICRERSYSELLLRHTENLILSVRNKLNSTR